MKKYWICFITLMLAASTYAEDEVKVTVTGDRVSLRAAPAVNSVLMDRAMAGDLLELKDNSNAEWIGVKPPLRVDVWVSSEFVKDGKVIPPRLNIRSGPSLNHRVVGVAEQGEALTVRGEAGGWLRIAPTAETIVWVSRKYAKIPGCEERPVAVIHAQPEAQPELNQMLEAVSGMKTLIPDVKKKQGVKMMLKGILRPAEGVLYKLVNPDVRETTICYVRGNSEQMQKFNGCWLSVSGRAYWALDLNHPFIRPVKIKLLSN